MSDKSDWIDWGGGECPVPDLKAGQFEVVLSGDGYGPPTTWDAVDFDWSIEDVYGDIIKYRIVGESK